MNLKLGYYREKNVFNLKRLKDKKNKYILLNKEKESGLSRHIYEFLKSSEKNKNELKYTKMDQNGRCALNIIKRGV